MIDCTGKINTLRRLEISEVDCAFGISHLLHGTRSILTREQNTGTRFVICQTAGYRCESPEMVSLWRSKLWAAVFP